MKNAYSFEKLSNTTGDFTSRVKNLFSSPLNKRKRAMSLNSVLNEPASSAIFGVSLEELAKKEGRDIPFIIRKIVLHVEENGLKEEGIYRVNGNARVIERLKDEFDKVGDAEFPDDDIAAVGGLLKLFLRQLPDGVIPSNLMPTFFQVQQAHPRDATPEALNKLQYCLQMLPPTNLAVLRYLVQHLTEVADHSEDNKMTPVSLSIVFGPNIFHCGSGLEALKRQGFSNAIMYRFIEFYRTLFGNSQSKELPTKPRPYSEHMADKALRQESHDTGSTHDVSVESHDLEESYSERSIDEAIQERSVGTLSPTSPTPLVEEPGPATIRSPPPRPPPPKVSINSEPLVVKPFKEQQQKNDSFADDASPSSAQDETDEPSNFSRRYAKRGMKYKAKNFDKDDSNSEGIPWRHRHSNGDVSSKVISRDEELPMRTPSPYSWQSSPGTSPPTSPALTPRSSRIISSVIEDSVKQFLFDSSTNSTQPDKGREQQHQTGSVNNHPPNNKADVYGLLLPERGQRSVGEPTTGGTVNDQSNITEIETDESSHVKLRQPNQANTDDTNSNATVVKRRSQNLKKLRNRKSALFGSSEEEPNILGDAPLSPIHDMDIQLVSVSPETTNQNGSNVEAMQGKVADLVKQYDKNDLVEESRQSVIGEASDGVMSEGSDALTSEKQSATNGSNKKHPNSKAFDMPKSGIIMGLGSPPPGLMLKKAVSFSSNHSSPPDITVEGDGNEHDPSDGLIEGERIGDPSARRTLTIVSEDLTGATSFSNCDEDVFISPRPSNSSTPRHKPHKERQLLSTTTSDDVFLSPLHTGNHDDQVDGGESAPLHEFDDVKRNERKLNHLTLDRPKGPASRRKPKQRHDSSPTTITNDTSRSNTTAKSHPSPSITSSIHPDGEDEPDFGIVETSKTGFIGSDEQQFSKPKSVPSTDTQKGISHPDGKRDRHIVEGERLNERMTRRTKSAGSPSRHKRSKRSSLVEHTTTQSTSNSISKPKQQPVVVPTIDLMSLAPEVKQTVKEGWMEGVSNDGRGVRSDDSGGTKTLSRRIHELKSTIREFEADFTAEHGHKPSGSEKAPVKAQSEEINKLRKQLKSLREKSTDDTSLSQTAPPEVPLADGTPVGSGARLTKLSMELSSDQLSPRSKRLASQRSSHGVASEGVSPLQETLNKILTSLAARRKTAGRPDNIHEMTADQIQEEKHAIQKALLNFEKVFGRPQSKSDKETMRPLYDRYRTVKRVCSGDAKRKESSISMLSVGLEVTAESLPSITILQSSTMSQSLTVETTMNSADNAESTIATHSGQSRGSSSKTSQVGGSQSAASIDDETIGSGHKESEPSAAVIREEEGVITAGEVTLMNSEELSQASLVELKSQYSLLMARKKEIRKVLKDFENEFQAKHGRPIQKRDREPKQDEYSDYKNTKARLKVVETLMLKNDPQKTV